jgi:UDP-N-acetylmuramate--alanine ligase
MKSVLFVFIRISVSDFMFQLKKVYLTGIGGIGVSALARFFVSKGIKVEGSDAERSEITEGLEKAGIKVNYEQKDENITEDIDLLIYSAAVPDGNLERCKAKQLGIKQKSYFEALADVTEDYDLVSVTGTHGKSTTTAMIAKILIDADKDPSAIVGSQCEGLDVNFRAGNSDLFVLESCEYRAHMLLLNPQSIVLTNIEEDHLDYYKDLNHIIQTFQQFVNKIKGESEKNKVLIYNNDDVNIRKLEMPDCKKISYGLVHGADLWAEKIKKESGKQIFTANFQGHDLGEFELIVPGDFNIYNALAAIAYSLTLDIPVGKIKESLKKFRGIWRRFEIIKDEKFTLVSDYAHHPTAINETLKAAREFYPGKRVVCVFQPHQHDRTQKLFDQFVTSFANADVLVMSEVYDVKGRNENSNVSSQDLIAKIDLQEKYYCKDLTETTKTVNSVVKNNDVVIVMGAGDIFQIVKSIK